MKDELKGPKVEKVSVAIVEMMVENEKSYYAYLLNLERGYNGGNHYIKYGIWTEYENRR